MTGNRRYLTPIPRCLDWLERVVREDAEAGRPPARYYEPGTNAPIYVVQTNRTDSEGFGLYEWTSDPSKLLPDWNRGQVEVAPLRREYERLAALSPLQLRVEWPDSRRRQGQQPQSLSAAEIVRRLDSRGAWVSDVGVLTLVPEGMSPSTYESMRGISTSSFVQNMWVLLSELEASPTQ